MKNTVPNTSSKVRGIAFSGGGARGAYQAGVLKGIHNISSRLGINHPFQAITGVSAGAINATGYAAAADNPALGVKKLIHTWSRLDSERVFKTDPLSFVRSGMKWMSQFSPTPYVNKRFIVSLLDTAPLRDLLFKKFPVERIQHNIDSGHIIGLAISAIDYDTTNSVTFVQANDSVEMWERFRRYSRREKITVDHLMASAAIPIFFPAVKIKGTYFGDGCLRNNSPISPAIHLGAEKIIVVGIRKEPSIAESVKKAHQMPTIGRLSSILLDSVFMDGMDFDLERLNRINTTVMLGGEEIQKNSKLKPIDFLYIQPSQDIGEMAQAHADKLPKIVNFTLKRMGSIEDAADIVSYLLFDSEFCSELIDLGFNDTLRREEEITSFFLEE